MLVVTAFTWAYIGASMPRGSGRYSAPLASPLQLLVYSLFITFIGLPVTILINRYVAFRGISFYLVHVNFTVL
jgi:hypothetical protein